MSSISAFYQKLLPSLRAQFPQIESLRNGRRRIYLDNAAGTLMPRTVADAMAEAALWANPQPERNWPGAHETSREHAETRRLLLDFVNADPADPIFLSGSTTEALYKLREGLEPSWETGDNLVVTDCDHFANISPWEWRARWEVRRAPAGEGGRLDLEAFRRLLDDRTRVVALTLASNGLGTILDLDAAIRTVRERAPGARVVIDAVHGAPHLPLDVSTLGADAVVFSTYKLFGPCCGVMWLRPDLNAELSPYRVEPHTDAVTLMEWGTLDNPTVSGIRAALEYVRKVGERLEPAFVGSLAQYPRERRMFKLAISAFREYEQEISARVLSGLADAPRVHVYGITNPEQVRERVPTFGFEVLGQDGQPLGDLERRLWEADGLQVADGSHYSAAVLRGLARPSLARASFSHYNTLEEADVFLRAAGGIA